MPGLRRILSKFAVGNDVDESQRPSHRRKSLLKRSNAVLRKKAEPPRRDDNLSILDVHRLSLVIADVPDRFGNRARPVAEFDDEIEAIARLRLDGGRTDEYARQHAGLDRGPSPSCQQPLDGLGGQQSALISEREYENDHYPPRYLDPLRAVQQHRWREAFVHDGRAREREDPSLDQFDHALFYLPLKRPTSSARQRSRAPNLHAKSFGRGDSGLANAAQVGDGSGSAGKGSNGPRHTPNDRLSSIEEYLDAVEYLNMPEDSAIDLAIRSLEEQLQAVERSPTHASSPTSPGSSEITPNIRDCIVCGDSKSTLEFPAARPTTSCTHPIQTCSDCLSTWLTSEITTNGTSPIKCPQCSQHLTHTDIQRSATPSTFRTYDNLSTRAALSALTDFAWCLSPTCASGQENTSNANFMHCMACNYQQCLSHRVPWHVGETCAQYDARTQHGEEEAQTAKMLDDVSKTCPNPKGCGCRIQKIDGCDHMTCRRCRWEFCWRCGASQKEIRRVGNTAHEGSCAYHSRNLEVGWPFNMH